MRILVTGGYGMMGRTIHSVVEDNTLYNKHKFTFLSRKDCDLTNRTQVFEYFKNNNFDYIIHLARR